MAGLDGLRGVALIAILGFHLEIPGFAGGFVGLPLFFSLSGYLIAQLVLREHEVNGKVSLKRFWGRRLRRLAPASLVALTVVGVLGIAGIVEGPRLRGDLLGGLAYFFNWRVASSGESYAELFTASPSPILHFWSLAIEEQFYFVFPLLMVLLLRTGRRSWLVGVLASLTVASFVSGLLTSSRDWFYYGTHVRAVEILLGVMLALHLPVGTTIPSRSRRALDAAAVVALVVFAAFVWRAEIGQDWVYGGGLAGIAVLGLVVVGAVVSGGVVARLASWSPLVVLGRTSYGIYLAHWPVIVVLDEERLGFDGAPLVVTRLAVTGAIAAVSYHLIENPIRHRRVLRAPRVALGAFAGAVVATAVVATFVSTSAPPVLAGVDAPTEIVEFGESTESSVPGSTTLPPPRATVTFVTSEVDGAAEFVDAIAAADPTVAVDTVFSPAGCPLGAGVDEAEDCPDHASLAAEVVDSDIIVLLVGEAERALLESRVVARLSPAADTVATATDSTTVVTTTDVTTTDVTTTVTTTVATTVATTDTVVDDSDPARQRTIAEAAEGEALAAALLAPFEDVPVIVVDLVGGDFLEGGLLSADLTSSQTWLDTKPTVDAFLDRVDEVLALVSDVDERASVVVIGDSVSFGMAYALNAVADDRYDVVWAGGQNCPLVEAHQVSWGRDLEFEMERCPSLAEWEPLWERVRPDLVLVVVSVPEQSDQQYEPDGEWYRVGDAEFTRRHDEVMARLVEITDEVGGKILFFDSPYISNGAFEKALFAAPDRVDGWNEAINGWATSYPTIHVVDWKTIVTTEEVSGPLREDGVHMTYDVLSGVVERNVLEILDSELAGAAG